MHYRIASAIAVLLCLAIIVGCGGGNSSAVKSQVPLAHPAASAIMPSAEQCEFYGDMDADERATVGDAIKILRIVVGLDPQRAIADANRNGGTDVGDAIKVLRCVVGLDPWPLARYGSCGSANLTAAMNAPVATAPVSESSGDTAVDLLEQWIDNEPNNITELESLLDEFTDLVTDNPNSSAGQLGLSLAIVGAGAQNAADVLGYCLFPEVDVTSVASWALADDYSPARTMNKAVNITMFRPWHQNPQTVSPQGKIPDACLTTEEVQDAIRAHILPTIESALSRLDALAQAPASTLLISYTDPDDGELYNLYPADANLLVAGLQLAKALMLQLVAYDLDAGSYDWELEPYERDANGDDVLTVDEYAPADPFLVLQSVQEMQQAGQALRNAVQRLTDSLDSRTSDPLQLVNRLLDEADSSPDDLRSYSQDVLAMLSGAVSVEMRYAHLNWQTWEWMNQGTTSIQLSVSRTWDNPVSDVKNLLPPLTVEREDLGGGEIEHRYKFTYDDLPDPTMNGVLPDAQIMNNILEADYEYLVAVYGSIEIEITNDAPSLPPPFP